MKTTKIFGFFDVKEYGSGRIKNEDEQIRFKTSYEEGKIPDELKARAHEYTNKKGVKMWGVDFKVGKNAQWFDASARPCAKPTNDELDKGRYEVVIDYKNVIADEKFNKTTKKYNADGLYVNAIMFRACAVNPFENDAFEPIPDAAPEAEAQPEAKPEAKPAPMVANESEVKQADSDLPF